jgi:hypothetical protein
MLTEGKILSNVKISKSKVRPTCPPLPGVRCIDENVHLIRDIKNIFDRIKKLIK